MQYNFFSIKTVNFGDIYLATKTPIDDIESFWKENKENYDQEGLPWLGETEIKKIFDKGGIDIEIIEILALK